jgi:hypothetical protein
LDCGDVVGLLKSYFKGRLRGLDLSDMAGRIVEFEGGLYKCLLCGRVRYRRVFEPGRDRRRSHVNIIFKCSGCGWSYSFEAELTGAGVPNVRRLYRELLGIVIPYNCPRCGRRFPNDVNRFEFQPGGGVGWDSMCSK